MTADNLPADSPATVSTPEVEGLREAACEVMHDAYEAAAIQMGWQTQERSRNPWVDLPEANKATMRAAVDALLGWLAAHAPEADRADGHVQFTDESGTWCSKDCPRPVAECGALAVRQNDESAPEADGAGGGES